MKCPNCDKSNVVARKKTTTQIIKSENIEFIAEAMVCPKCSFSFFTDMQADTAAQLASDKYRKQQGLMTSDEIIACRSRIGMSQAEFAAFLSVGVASLKRWEGIGIQDASLDQLIKLKCNPDFSADEAMKLDERFVAGIQNGNRKFSKVKYNELTKIMLVECKSPLFANKGLFFADFLHHRTFNVGITGAVYRRQEHGPVPYVANSTYKELLASNEVEKGDHPHNLNVVVNPDWSVFDDDEQEVIRTVIKMIRKVGFSKLVDISHLEDGWLEKNQLEIIDYSYSKKLKFLK